MDETVKALRLFTHYPNGLLTEVGGITEDELRQKASEGSPAAQAILQAVEKKTSV